MSEFTLSSGGQQVAAHLRAELLRGRWSGTMPGRERLSVELGVSNKLVDAALLQLEREGLLRSAGPRRRRRIVVPGDVMPPSLRVAILDHDPQSRGSAHFTEVLHRLIEAGHTAFSARLTLTELGMKVSRVARLVNETKADAWVIGAGSREILAWFAARKTPALALFGRARSLPIAAAGPDKPPAVALATRRLVELGHRRIVLLARAARRKPEPGAPERAFLNELKRLGIEPSDYHLPDWEESPKGLESRLDSLLEVTPPTALIIDEVQCFIPVLQFLARRGVQVPDDMSLISTDGDPHFSWCRPTIAHIRWDIRPVLRRVARWAENVSRGAEDLRQTLTKATFVEGGTLGPARASLHLPERAPRRLS